MGFGLVPEVPCPYGTTVLTKPDHFWLPANAWAEQAHQCVPQSGVFVHSHVPPFLFDVCKYRVCTGGREQASSAGTVYMPEA